MTPAIKRSQTNNGHKVLWLNLITVCVAAGVISVWLVLQWFGHKARHDLVHAANLVQINFNLKSPQTTPATQECLSSPPSAVFDLTYVNFCDTQQNLLAKISSAEQTKLVDSLNKMRKDGWEPWGIEYYNLTRDLAYQKLFDQIALKNSERDFATINLSKGTVILQLKIFDKTTVDYMQDPESDLQGLDLLSINRKDIPVIANNELFYVFNLDDTYLKASWPFPIFKSILNRKIKWTQLSSTGLITHITGLYFGSRS